MRVTSGQAKGILIKAPKGMRTRPTSDKLRGALFDTLRESVVRARALDLFAGSGALGIEALSRGAEHVVFVESDPNAVRTIGDNLAKTRLSEKGEIIRADFRLAVRKLQKRGEKFDLVFIDPPYQGGLLEDVAGVLTKHCITSPEAIIVIEHFKKTEPPPSISGIPLARTRNYGQTALSYFQCDERAQRNHI